MIPSYKKYSILFGSIVISLSTVLSAFIQPSNIEISVRIIDSKCTNDGALVVSISDSSLAPYRFRLDTAFRKPPYKALQNENIFNALHAREYTLVIVDKTGKETSKIIKIGGDYSPPRLDATLNCNAVSLTVTGGRRPFRYHYLRGSFQSDTSFSPDFSCLKRGDYRFEVLDSCDNKFPHKITVTDVLPSFNYFCSGKNITISNAIGCRPYYFILKNENGDSLINNTGKFTLFNGCTFNLTMRDSCGNQSTQYINCTPLNLNYNCKYDSSQTIHLIGSGGSTPYSYYLIVDNKDTLFSKDGVFKNLNKCSIRGVVKDSCGTLRSEYVNCKVASEELLLEFLCVNHDKGTVSILAKGGTPPYIYKDIANGSSNSTGVFTKLTSYFKYEFEIIDACGVSKRAWAAQNAYINFKTCPYDSILELKMFESVYIQNQCGSYYFNDCTIDFPKTQKYVCTTCDSTVSYKLDTVTSIATFKPIAPALHKFGIVNSCNDTIYQNVKVEKKGFRVSINETCIDEYQLQTFLSPNQSNTIYILKSNNEELERNMTGRFKISNPDARYWVIANNETCNSDSAFIDISPRMIETVSCDQINISICPKVPGYSLTLKSNDVNTIETNTTGIFTNLLNGTEYRILLNHSLLNTQYAETYITPAFHFSVTNIGSCSFDLKETSQNTLNLNEVPSYIILDSNNVIVDSGKLTQPVIQVTGLLPDHTYKVIANHKSCGSESKMIKTLSFQVPQPFFCVTPGFESRSDSFQLKYEVNSPYRLFNLLDNIEVKGTGLASGKYIIKAVNAACTNEDVYLKDTIVIPEIPGKILKISSQTAFCPQSGAITVSMQDSIWEKWAGHNFLLCSNRNSWDRFYFHLFDSSGKILLDKLEANGYSNRTFSGPYLIPGRWYTIKLSNYWGRDFIDNIKYQLPIYTRSSINIISDVLCEGVDTGCIQFSIINGIVPYTFEITGNNYSKVIKDTSVSQITICNLKRNDLILRAFDYCGISIDSRASMSTISMATSATPIPCSDSFLLTTNLVLNTKYQWTNLTINTNIKSSNSAELYIRNPSPVSVVYGVNLQTSNGCVLSDSVVVPGFFPNRPIKVNAGIDRIIKTGLTTPLTALVDSIKVTGKWLNLNNNPGIALFQDSSQFETSVVVFLPGRYGFLYRAFDGCNYAVDTVFIEFLNCLPFITNQTDSSCDLSQVGIEIDTFLSILSRCDSVVVTNIVYIQPKLVSITKYTCESGQAGQFFDTIFSASVCRTIIVTTFIYRKPDTITQVISACDSSFIDGTWLKLSGIYVKKIKDQYGCDSVYFIIVLKIYEHFFKRVQKNLCPGGVVSWHGNSYQSVGLFVERFTSPTGCDSIFELTIRSAPPLYIFAFPNDTTVVLGQRLKPKVQFNFIPLQIDWTPKNKSLSCYNCINPIIYAIQKQIYTIFAMDTNNCSVMAKFTIGIELPPVYIPNIFTPNGDGINDYFYLSGNPEIIIIKRFRIYDKWGSLIYSEQRINLNDPKRGWDGNFGNINSPSGVYIYFAELEYINGDRNIYKGDVTLIR